MSDFTVTIIANEQESIPNGDRSRAFGSEQHTATGDKELKDIEKLEKIWPALIKRLDTLASESDTKEKPGLELDQIEFNVGFEAGLSIGFVTKANASVSIVFKKKR